MAVSAVADCNPEINPVDVISPTRRASLLRRTIEIASRSLTLRRNLPAAFGHRPIYVSPANALQFLKPGDAKFDPLLLWLVEEFVAPDSCAWDIGANGGVFTAAAATVARTVVAFEPDPFNVALIKRTMRANPDLDIRLVPAALSDRAGETKLNIPRRGRSVASIEGIPMGSQSGGLRDRVAVRMTTADDCLGHYPAPSFVKCDIEGAEALVLAGARTLLSNVRPVFCMEVRDGTRRGVEKCFRDHGYCFASADAQMRPLVDLSDVCDFIARPAPV